MNGPTAEDKAIVRGILAAWFTGQAFGSVIRVTENRDEQEKAAQIAVAYGEEALSEFLVSDAGAVFRE